MNNEARESTEESRKALLEDAREALMQLAGSRNLGVRSDEERKIEPDEIVENALLSALNALRKHKPGDRSENDRRYAVTITEMEKVWAYFDTYVLTGGNPGEQ